MAVVLYSDEERARHSRIIQRVNHEWTMEQVAKGVDGPTPDDRKEPSDYNQHVPALEASGEDLDDLAERIRRALAE